MLEKIKNNKFKIGIIFISLIYFVFTSVQNPIFYYKAGYDDLYMLASAMFMLDLDWLGPFSGVTLTKGIGTPVFIAIANTLGLTFLQAQFLLYLGAAILFVNVLKKVIKSDFVRLILFFVILFNPVIYDVELLRIYRDSINSSFLLYVVAFSFGIFFNYRENIKKIIPYMIGFGIFSTCMAITREEAIWIAPFTIGSSVITCLFIIFDKNCLDKLKKILLYLIPITIYILTIFVICLLNKIAYGEFIRIENNSKPFKDFMKAVSSVDVENPNILVPLPKEAREKLYEVSPSFSELKDYFENGGGSEFADAGSVEGEIENGWLSWAIISGVHEQGYDSDLKSLNDYYRRVTKEVNEAYEDGRLKKEDNPASIFDDENFNKFLENFKKAFNFQIGVENIFLKPQIDTFYVENPDFPREREDVFREITGNSSTNTKSYDYKIDNIKLKMLTIIASIYQKLSKPLFILGLVIYIIMLLQFFFGKLRFSNYKQIIILTSFIMLHFIRILVIAYTETAMCSAINVMYLSSTYSLQFAFEVLSIVFFVTELIKFKKKSVEKNSLV